MAAHSLGGGNLCRRPPRTRVSAASRSRRSSFSMKGPLPWFVSSSAKALCPVMCYGWLLWCRGTAGRHVAYGDAPGTRWVLRPSCGSRRCALWGMPGGLPLPKGVAGCDQGPRAELRPGPQALQPRHPHCGLTPNAVLTSRQGRGWMVWGPEWRAEDPGDARGKSSNPAETPGLALAPSSPSPGEGVRRGRRRGHQQSSHCKAQTGGTVPKSGSGGWPHWRTLSDTNTWLLPHARVSKEGLSHNFIPVFFFGEQVLLTLLSVKIKIGKKAARGPPRGTGSPADGRLADWRAPGSDLLPVGFFVKICNHVSLWLGAVQTTFWSPGSATWPRELKRPATSTRASEGAAIPPFDGRHQ